MKTWIRRCLALSAGVAVTAMIMGCDDSDSSSGGGSSGTGVAGDWRASGNGFSSTMHIDASGNSLTGAVVYDGDSDGLTGTIDGNTVQLRSQGTSGTGTLEGDTIRGTYRRDNGDSGSWTATRL
jgi:hypothetical protein